MHNGILKSDSNISQRTVYGLEYKILIFPEFRKISQISIHNLRLSFLFSFYVTLGSCTQSLILATTLLLQPGLEWVLVSLWPKSPSLFHFQFLSFQICVMCCVHTLIVMYGKGNLATKHNTPRICGLWQGIWNLASFEVKNFLLTFLISSQNIFPFWPLLTSIKYNVKRIFKNGKCMLIFFR